ncbi:MAG: hypothetical protein CL927_19945 [Deltaproteobacteria bacterium]|nr:hypothetical protein [Deltaproteobacteria bacterium]HCH65669.1 hypothetical protein [Deltaproteobacteria bacterium]
MGCGLLSALFGVPRFGFAAVWLLKPGYIQSALGGNTLFLLLGFLFLPLTTLGFAYGMNDLAAAPGTMTPMGWVLTGIGFAIDIGLVSRRRGART